jgi:hypothetical protein
MSSTLQQFADLAAKANNKGAEALNAGELAEAMNIFRDALEESKNAFATESHVIFASENNNGSSNNNTSTIVTASNQARSCVPLFTTTMDSKQQAHSSDTSIPMFAHPISIDPSIQDDEGHYFCTNPDIDNSIFSAIIIYNMAISCHLMVKKYEGQTTNVAYRTTAATLYDMCAQLLCIASSRPVDIPITGLGNAICDLMTMALLNNQAEINLNAMDYQQSILRLQYLAELSSSSINTDAYGDTIVASIMERARLFFLTNAITSMHVSDAAPAA